MKRGRTGYQCPEEGCEFFCDDRDSFIAHMLSHAKSPELEIEEKKVGALVSTNTEIMGRLKAAIHDNLSISCAQFVHGNRKPHRLEKLGALPLCDVFTQFVCSHEFTCPLHPFVRFDKKGATELHVKNYATAIQAHSYLRECAQALLRNLYGDGMCVLFDNLRRDLERLQVVLGELEGLSLWNDDVMDTRLAEINALRDRYEHEMRAIASVNVALPTTDHLTLIADGHIKNLKDTNTRHVSFTITNAPSAGFNVFIGNIPVTKAVFKIANVTKGGVFVGLTSNPDVSRLIFTALRESVCYSIYSNNIARYGADASLTKFAYDEDACVVVAHGREGKYSKVTFHKAEYDTSKAILSKEYLDSERVDTGPPFYPIVMVLSTVSIRDNAATIELDTKHCVV